MNNFILLVWQLRNKLNLSEERVLPVYIHNLSYEFQFIRKWFNWSKVFAIDKRKPVRASTKDGIEFRCSYILSGYSLRNLPTKKYAKLDGDLDYNKLRLPSSKITDDEWYYIVYDTKKVVEYIDDQRRIYNGVEHIPLTKTSKVRNYCRQKCLPKDDKAEFYKYRRIMDMCQIDSAHEYDLAKLAFAGGFTHASWSKSGKVHSNVDSFDLCSSYPAVMAACYFPMSRATKVLPKNEDEFINLLNNYCCVFTIHFVGLESDNANEHPLSLSRCELDRENYKSGSNRLDKVRVATDNGRIISCDGLTTTITELDFFTIRDFYTWEYYQIMEMYIFRRDYLPKPFIQSILKFYSDKTTLKDVEGSEEEYMKSKENANSCYGMAVTDIIRDEYCYSGVWYTMKKNAEEELIKYNNSSSRFLSYWWGIWVTAHARRRLFKAIYVAGDDYIYSDTDSVKLLHSEYFMEYVKAENKVFKEALLRMCEYYKIDPTLIEPKTKEGKTKLLGAWEYETTYDKFKTLGAKRYMIKKKNALKVGDKKYDYSLTVSGVNKYKALPYLLDTYGDDIFEAFDEDLVIPPKYTGKNTLTYVDEEITGVAVDCYGEIGSYYERSFIHMEAAEYHLGLEDEYRKLIFDMLYTEDIVNERIL